MNFNTTLIGILFLLIFIVPIVYSIINAKATKKKTKKLTEKLMNTHQITPTETFDIADQHFFVDANSNKILHTQITKSKMVDENVWDIKGLKSIKTEISHYTTPSNTLIIDSINLNVEENNGMTTEILIYDERRGNITEVDHYKLQTDNLVYKINALKKN